MFVKFDVREELQKMVEGRPMKAHPATIAALVLGSLEPQRKPKTAKKRGDSLNFLERLYRLEDPRGL
jgi:hypothetical protein